MSSVRMSKIEAALRVVLAFHEAFNRHDVDEMMQYMSDDCRFENTSPAPEGTKYTGKAAVAQFWREFFANSPHAHIDIEEIFGLGERCVMRWRYRWIDAQGNPGYVRGVDVYLVRDGLIREKLSYVKG